MVMASGGDVDGEPWVEAVGIRGGVVAIAVEPAPLGRATAGRSRSGEQTRDDVQLLPVPERVGLQGRAGVDLDPGVHPGLVLVESIDVVYVGRCAQAAPPEAVVIPELALRFLPARRGVELQLLPKAKSRKPASTGTALTS